jgi:hypothetical protein
MSLQIGQLATELLHIIFSNLDLSTLRNCRLVQRLGREIGNEHFLPAICTNNLAELSGMNFARNDVVMGHVRSITFMKNELEEWRDQSTVSEAHGLALLGQGLATSHCSNTILNPFKRLEKLAILDGRPFPTLD